eukprot:5207887-Pyramimonas_sp.AAC.1
MRDLFNLETAIFAVAKLTYSRHHQVEQTSGLPCRMRASSETNGHPAALHDVTKLRWRSETTVCANNLWLISRIRCYKTGGRKAPYPPAGHDAYPMPPLHHPYPTGPGPVLYGDLHQYMPPAPPLHHQSQAPGLMISSASETRAGPIVSYR